MRLMNSRFFVIWARLDHFEARLMILSQEEDAKILRMASQFKYFDEKKQNADCNMTNSRLVFSFEISFEAPAFKVPVFANDLEFLN